MLIKESEEALNIINKIFQQNNISYWLDKGTLIGCIRQKNLIKWDNDIDLSVDCNPTKLSHIKNNTSVKKFEFYYNGHYSMRNKKTKKHFICLLHCIEKNNKIQWIDFIPPLTYIICALESNTIDYAPLDYFVKQGIKIKTINTIYKKTINTLFTISKKIKNKQQLINLLLKLQVTLRLYRIKYSHDLKIVFPLQKGFINNNTYPVPNKSTEYLEAHYGNWKIPKHKGKLVKQWRGKKLKLNKKNEMVT